MTGAQHHIKIFPVVIVKWLYIHAMAKRMCRQCIYSTSNTMYLKRHLLDFHENVNVYKCMQYNYSASQAGNLK